MTSLRDVAEEWCTLKDATSQSTNRDASARVRRNDLIRFFTALSRPGPAAVSDDPLAVLDEITYDDMTQRNLLAALATVRQQCSPATAARTVSTVRGFLRHLTRNGLIPPDPVDMDLFKVPVTDAEIPAVNRDAVERIRSIAASGPAGPHRARWPVRDELVISLLADCGLRVAEACALQVRDVDTTGDRPILRVVRATKRGRRRDVPLPRHVTDTISRYLTERADHGLPVDDDSLLLIRPPAPGRPLNQPFVDRLLRRCATEAAVTLPDGAAAHALRHHYGAELAIRGVPMPVIQQLLGHVDPRTTSVYTRVAARELIDPLDDAGWL